MTIWLEVEQVGVVGILKLKKYSIGTPEYSIHFHIYDSKSY